MDQHYDIFISYSRRDTPVADRVCAALDRAGITYFIDRKGIAGGMEFPRQLAYAIVNSSIFLLLASKNSYESPYINNEITFAFNRRRTMLPYIIDDSEMPLELEFTFAKINWRTISEHPIDTVLVNDLLTLLGRPAIHNTASAQPSVVPAQHTCVQASAPTSSDAEALYRHYCDTYDTNSLIAAAEMGYAEAQYRLGSVYEREGVNGKRSFALSAQWILKAALQGHEYASSTIAHKYYIGMGVDQDYAEAVHWYRKAAEQDDTSAMEMLGYIYRTGKGSIKPDMAEAIKWYRLAADKGNYEANVILRKLGAM